MTSYGALQHETVTPTNNPLGPTDKKATLTFDDIPTFNPDLGTLVSVKFTLDLNSTAFVDIKNTKKKTEAYKMALAINESGSFTLTVPTTGGKEKFTDDSGKDKVAPSSGEIAGKTTEAIYGKSEDSKDSLKITDPTSMYIGGAGDTYDLTGKFKEIPGFAGGVSVPGVFFSGGDELFADLSVEYFYMSDVVPEPTTLPLVALSLGALFFGRRFLVKRSLS